MVVIKWRYQRFNFVTWPN